MKKLRGWCYDARDEYERKAAVMEYHGGRDRIDAETSAFLHTLKRRKDEGLPVLIED